MRNRAGDRALSPLGAALRRLRLRANLTQERLAMYLGCTPSTISRCENGYHVPARLLLRAYVRFFDLRGGPIRAMARRRGILEEGE